MPEQPSRNKSSADCNAQSFRAGPCWKGPDGRSRPPFAILFFLMNLAEKRTARNEAMDPLFCEVAYESCEVECDSVGHLVATLLRRVCRQGKMWKVSLSETDCRDRYRSVAPVAGLDDSMCGRLQPQRILGAISKPRWIDSSNSLVLVVWLVPGRQRLLWEISLTKSLRAAA